MVLRELQSSSGLRRSFLRSHHHRTVLRLDPLFTILSSVTSFNPINTSQFNTDTLFTNTTYVFDAEVDVSSAAVNLPEPSSILFLATVVIAIGFA